MKSRQKVWYIIVLGVMYVVSFILLTVGFFTPNWVMYGVEWRSSHSPLPDQECTSTGLVSGDCRYPYNGNMSNLGKTIRVAFWAILASMIVVYINTVMVLLALLVSRCHDNPIYMTFLSVNIGVLYPAAALLTLGMTLYIEAKYTYKSGFSVIISTIAGGLMLMFYIGVLVYDRLHILSRKQKKPEAGIQH